jgi:GGDEF domain-containing protein
MALSFGPMDNVAAGFWGAFFGTVALMLAVALAAYARSRQRVALTAGLSALISGVFVAAYLGWVPLPSREAQHRLLAHVAVASAVPLSLMLLSLLGVAKPRAARRRLRSRLVACALVVIAIGWALDAQEAFALGTACAFAAGAAMLAVSVRSALRGDRVAWEAVSGISFMLAAIAGLSWIAWHADDVPAWVHILSASASWIYLSLVGTALWTRYSYLIELSEVMAHGPSHDPVTRMRSHSETGQLVSEVFRPRAGEDRSIGVIVAMIANLDALENLHGRAALNHALFVSAGRLRRCAPNNFETGRLGEDAFILLVRDLRDIDSLVQVARQVCERLSRPIDVGKSRDPALLESQRSEWAPQLGVSVLVATPQAKSGDAIAVARAMARTAWSYPSRIAWFDRSEGRIAELPLAGSA